MSTSAETLTKIQFGDFTLLKLPSSVKGSTCPEEFAGKPLFLGGMRKTMAADFDKAFKKYIKLLGSDYSESNPKILNIVDASSLPQSPLHLFNSSYTIVDTSTTSILDIPLEGDATKISVDKIKVTLSNCMDKTQIVILEILKINMPDRDVPISLIFPYSNTFIAEAFLKNQPLIVGCEMGISRSVSLLSAFLVLQLRMPISSPDGTTTPEDDDAIVYLKRQRSRACPNFSFETQLYKLSLESRREIPSTCHATRLMP